MPSKSTHFGGQKMPVKLRLKLANDCPNLISRVKLSSENKRHKFYFIHSEDATEATFGSMMILFEVLMRENYEKSSWGWNETEKLSEWKHSRTRIIIVTNSDIIDSSTQVVSRVLPPEDEEIIGFMCLRFETGADKNECALYVYELHVDTEHQRQGLGGELMRMAKALAAEFKMDKIMLTVFRSNQPALQFYNKLKFITDKSSPEKNESDYIILSSKIKG